MGTLQAGIGSAANTDGDTEVVSLRFAWGKWQIEAHAFGLKITTLTETLDGLFKAEDTQ